MAQYQHLPIYKTTYELLGAVTRLTAGFPKAHKYSLGEKIRGEVVEMIVYIFKANSSRAERAEHAGVVLERVQVSAWKEQGRLAVMLHKGGYGAAVPKQLNNARFPR